MAWLRLTPHTKAGMAGIKKAGDAIDSQFLLSEADYWKEFWAHPDRKKYLRRMKRDIGTLVKVAAENGPCERHGILGNQIYNNGYNFAALDRPELLLRSECAGSGESELLTIIKSGMFERVFLRPGKPNRIICITEPIIIDDCPMGRYRIDWTANPLFYTGMGPSKLYFPAHANFDWSGCTHPHIHTSGGYCAGEMGAPLGVFCRGGLIADAMGLILQYLKTYGKEDPYRALEYWTPGGSASAQPVCANCHLTSRKALPCPTCFATSCQGCWGGAESKTCPICGRVSKKRIFKIIRKKTDGKTKGPHKTKPRSNRQRRARQNASTAETWGLVP